MKRFWKAWYPLVTVLIAFFIFGCSHPSASAEDREGAVKGNVPVTYIPRSEITFDADGNFKVTHSQISSQTEVRIIAVTNYRAGTNDRHIRICVTGQDLQFLSTDPYGIPFVDDQNRVQVPVRKFTEAIGGTVRYDDEKKTVSITSSTDTVVFRIGSNKMLCNGAEREIDTAAQNIEGRTYIPLRALSEALGYRVVYTAKDAAAADCRISRDEVIAGKTRKQFVGAPAAAPTPLTSEELDTLVELYNQMCMISPRCEVDQFDTVNSYDNWVYLTMQDGLKIDLCLRMQDEWEIRCFAGSDEEDNCIMHSPDLYAFITRLYHPEQA